MMVRLLVTAAEPAFVAGAETRQNDVPLGALILTVARFLASTRWVETVFQPQRGEDFTHDHLCS